MTEILARTLEKSVMKFDQAQRLGSYIIRMDTCTKIMILRKLLGNFLILIQVKKLTCKHLNGFVFQKHTYWPTESSTSANHKIFFPRTCI